MYTWVCNRHKQLNQYSNHSEMITWYGLGIGETGHSPAAVWLRTNCVFSSSSITLFLPPMLCLYSLSVFSVLILFLPYSKPILARRWKFPKSKVFCACPGLGCTYHWRDKDNKWTTFIKMVRGGNINMKTLTTKCKLIWCNGAFKSPEWDKCLRITEGYLWFPIKQSVACRWLWREDIQSIGVSSIFWISMGPQ